MSVGAEERFVLDCVRTWVSRAANDLAITPPPDLNWPRLLRQAGEQRVLALLLARVGHEQIPEAARPAAAAGRRMLASDSLRLTGALVDLTERFRAAGLPVLPLKGPTLARQAYGDVGLRAFADLDLLVHPPDLARARALLLGLGFEPSYPTTPSRRALLQRLGSHESLEHPDGTWVELHWRVAAPVSEFRLDYGRLWSRLGTIRLAGHDLPALRPDDLLILLALHGAKHAWERLGWICDVGMLIAAEPALDWDAALRESERMRAERVLFLALRLAADLLGAELPEAVEVAARSDPAVDRLVAWVQRNLFGPLRSGAGTFGFHLDTRARWRDKLALVAGGLTALNQRDLELVRLPEAALPLYFVARPLRLVGKSIAHALRGGAPAQVPERPR